MEQGKQPSSRVGEVGQSQVGPETDDLQPNNEVIIPALVVSTTADQVTVRVAGPAHNLEQPDFSGPTVTLRRDVVALDKRRRIAFDTGDVGMD